MEDGLSQRLLKVADVGKLLTVSVRTIWRMRSAGEIPEPITVGRSVRWYADDIQEWLAARRPRPQ